MDSEETRDFWNRVAADWNIQVGTAGDRNRILNSDPVLWQFAGDVEGLDVLDAGCGTGYLSGQLQARGARVVGVDFSPEMHRIAKSNWPELEFRVDSVDCLTTVGDATMDLVVSNYVLMDAANLEDTVAAFHRVLRPQGHVVAVFSHPCFPAGRVTKRGLASTYEWDFPYFERRKCVDPPWGHFTSPFTWFHRPLSDYFKAFVRTGFDVCAFEEPHLTPDRYDLAESPEERTSSTARPYSVAFKLRKRSATTTSPDPQDEC